MNKSELAIKVAERLKVKKTHGLKLVDAVLEEVINALRRGEPVRIDGALTVYVAKQGARSGRNPRTGGIIEVRAKNLIRVRVHANWIKKIN